MNPDTTKEAVKNFGKISELATKYKNVETAVCVPPVYLGLLKGESLLGAQNVFDKDAGAYTGEVSPLMLSDVGVRYVIVGHSERRSLGETNEDVAKKVVACIKHGFTPIICIGESSRDADNYSDFVADQVKKAVSKIPAEAVPQVVFAYEPIWAIGEHADRPATAEEAKEMKLFVRKVLTDIAGEYAQNVRIMYGGSTNPDNTEKFLKFGEADGLLVGGASLDPKRFGEMLEIANNL